MSMSAGPQPQAKNYNPREEPHIVFGFEATDHRTELIAWCTRDAIEITEIIYPPEGEPFGEHYPITLERLFDYLRQLPRPISNYYQDDAQ